MRYLTLVKEQPNVNIILTHHAANGVWFVKA